MAEVVILGLNCTKKDSEACLLCLLSCLILQVLLGHFSKNDSQIVVAPDPI